MASKTCKYETPADCGTKVGYHSPQVQNCNTCVWTKSTQLNGLSTMTPTNISASALLSNKTYNKVYEHLKLALAVVPQALQQAFARVGIQVTPSDISQLAQYSAAGTDVKGIAIKKADGSPLPFSVWAIVSRIPIPNNTLGAQTAVKMVA